jgi:hypothetical protein
MANTDFIKSVLIGLLVVVVTGAFIALGYLYIQMQREDAVENPVTNSSIEMKQTKDPSDIKITAPFYLKNASPEYTQLNLSANGFVTDLSKPAQGLQKSKAALYASLLSFAGEQTRSKQERAYALNLVNLLFTLGFDAATLREGIAGNSTFKKSFDAHFARATKLPKKGGGMKGVMYNNGEVAMNYAAQKTMAEINDLSYSLHKTSYALLRKNLNTIQADSLLQGNFETGVSIDAGDVDQILAHNYGEAYIDSIDSQVGTFIAEGTLYKDLYASSYEADIMYSTGVLWTKYLALPKDAANKQKRRTLLDEILKYNAHMVTISNEYNTGRLFFGYVISAFSTSRIAQINVYSDAEKKELQRQAAKGLLYILETSKNVQLGQWLKNLPKTGWMYREFERLSKQDAQIGVYFKAVYAK